MDSSTGFEIKSGDDTRLLVGMARTDASSQFQDSATQRFVLNWFNRRNLMAQNSTGTQTTSSTSAVEVNGSSTRAEFLVWSSQTVQGTLSGSGWINTAPNSGYMMIWLDGNWGPPQAAMIGGSGGVSNFIVPVHNSSLWSPPEGYHFVTAGFWVTGGQVYLGPYMVQAIIEG